MGNDNQVILSVKVDEGDSEKRLAALVLAIEQTQQAQKELTKAREAGKVSAEEYAQGSVKLTNQLITQRAEQSSLTKEVTKAAPETKKLGSSLLEAAQSSDALGGATRVLSAAKEKYTLAVNLARAATAGEVAVLGALKLALLATGLGAFVVILGSLVSFFTKTQAGADLLSRKMAGLGAVMRVVTNLAADFGGKLVAAADDPKQAFSDLVDFIGTNLLNRLKAFGVIVDAIRSRDLTKLSDGFIQLGTGITDGTAKAKALVAEMGSAAAAAENLKEESQRLLAAERALNVARDESRARIEGLKKLSDDASKSVATRAAAAKQAAQIENGLLAEQLRLQDAKIANLRATQALQKNLTNEDKDALAELRSERAKTAQESLTLQTELQNKINSLATESVDKRVALRKAELDSQAQALDRQLKVVQVNSDEELRLLRVKLETGYQAELNVKGLTVKAKRAIDEKYEGDSLALVLDFNRRKLLAALQAQADLTAADLAGQQAGSAEALRLQAQQIEEQRQQAIAGLAANANNVAAIAKINATAAQQQRELEYQQVAKALQEDIARRKRLVENAYADGLLKEREYQEKLAQLTKIGADAQTNINQRYLHDNSENQAQADAAETQARQRHTADVKRTEEAKQEIRETTVQSFQAGTDLIIQLFGAESAAGQASLAFRKVLALAEIGINLQKTLSLNAVAAAELGAIPLVGPALGAAYLATHNALAIAQAAISAATVLAFEQGGIAHVGSGTIADGPSHRQGGIQLYHRGRHAGIEIEGGEPVLTRQVSQSPLLLSMASAINQLAGGRALAPASSLLMPRMALGGITQPLVLQQLRGDTGQSINYKQLGKVLADELRANPPVNRWSHFEKAQRQAAETKRLTNS